MMLTPARNFGRSALEPPDLFLLRQRDDSEPPPPEIAARTGCWASLWSELKNPGTATGVIGIVIGVIGIVLAIYFHYKSEKFSEVEMFVEQIQVFDKTKSGVVPLRVLDASGNQIDNNILAASITIWNSGNVEIKKEDVRQPFRLSVRGGDSNVIDITPLFYSKEILMYFPLIIITEKLIGTISTREKD